MDSQRSEAKKSKEEGIDDLASYPEDVLDSFEEKDRIAEELAEKLIAEMLIQAKNDVTIYKAVE